ncbi:hypothetical protein [Actinoplanes sp. NPDC020271]|uniref:hypothetical protein n=1 Tax=Actinoplanes sp. NPDC020271 TaxID=3363896 RepID=UPI0037A4A8E8
MFTRTVVIAAAATALFALTACDKASSDTTAAAPATTKAGTAPSAPAATKPATTKPATESTTTKPVATKPKSGCPVTAATLQGVADFPAGWKVDAASLKCKDNWAVAGMIAPTPEQQGDGQVFFAYDAKSGKWSKKGEGSSVDCGSGSSMNVPASTGFCG